MEKIKTVFMYLFCLILACIFIYAGVIKMISPDKFFTDILNYQITSDLFTYFSAYFLPPFEIVLGVSLFFRKYRILSAILIIALTIIFTIAIVSAWIRGINISCGCFGGNEIANYPSLILRDIGIIATAITILLLNKNKYTKLIYEQK